MRLIKESLVKVIFSPELDKYIQQDPQENKVFRSCLSSPVNDVVVQILSGLDMDEDYGIASMETSSSKQTNDMEFWERNKTMYAIFQSEMQKDHKEVVVLFNSFEDYGSKNVLRTEEVEKEKQTLVKESCPSVLVHQKEMFSHVFYDLVACYMENFNNHNL